MLPKTSTYVKSYDGQTKWMYFLIEDDKMMKKYNTIWDKVNQIKSDEVSADIEKEFDSDPIYNKEFLKTKVKSHGNKVTGFSDKKIPKVDYNHTFIAVVTSNSTLKKDENYYISKCS